MPIIEDDVKVAMESFLKDQGFTSVKVQLGTRQGYDVAGTNPVTGKTLVIECKGEAKTGSQHSRSWPNVASAILTSLNELEDPLNSNEVAMAFPDTNEYRERMRLLQPCIDPLKSCTGVIVEGNDDEYPDGRRYQTLDGQA